MARILMVTPYPPQPDGIGAYAVQAVRRMRAEGHDVEVLSPGPSAAHHNLDLAGPRGALALAKRVRRYDEVIVQFHPAVFYAPPYTDRALTAESLALALAFRVARKIEVRVHEIDYSWGTKPGRVGRATRQLWRGADRMVVHTDREKREFVEAFGVRPDRVEVTAHGTDFTRHTTATKAEARRSLRLGADEFVFLSTGFIQSHKGFDRAVTAFSSLRPRNASLHVVGGVRLEDGEQRRYSESLAALVDDTPGAQLHVGFLSDEEFDRWIVAADAVVLPYRHIWSSGVLERAHLYGVPVIGTDVGGLAEQAGDRAGLTIVADDDELRAAMARALGFDADLDREHDVSWSAGPSGRADVQAEIERRAFAARGHAPPPVTAARVPSIDAAGDAASLPLRELSPFERPSARRARVGRRTFRRFVRKTLTAELAPLVEHVNALQNATAEAVERAAAAPAPDAPDQSRNNVTPRAIDTPGQ